MLMFGVEDCEFGREAPGVLASHPSTWDTSMGPTSGLALEWWLQGRVDPYA